MFLSDYTQAHAKLMYEVCRPLLLRAVFSALLRMTNPKFEVLLRFSSPLPIRPMRMSQSCRFTCVVHDKNATRTRFDGRFSILGERIRRNTDQGDGRKQEPEQTPLFDINMTKLYRKVQLLIQSRFYMYLVTNLFVPEISNSADIHLAL